VNPDPAELAAASAHLAAGGVVALPTDTVPGLACLASSPAGVRAIFALKGRDEGKPLILFVETLDGVARLAGGLAPRLRRLLERSWPGPLTAVLPLQGTWPPGVGRDGTAGYRIPDHPAVRALLAAAGQPLATTSANLAGQPPLASAGDAAGLWGGRVRVVPGDGGGSTPSTVADCTTWPPRIIRAGAVSQAALDDLVASSGPER